MVFAFPSGLNQELFPLAWLVGEWEGEGQISYHEQVPTARAWNHIKFSHDGGSYLKYESTIRIIGEGEAPIPGPVLPAEPIGASYGTGHSAQPFEVAGGDPSDEALETTGAAGGGEPDDVPGTSDPDDAEAAAFSEQGRNAEVDDVARSGVEPVETPEGVVAPHDGEVWSSETGYWRINPLPHGSGKDNEFYLDIFIVDAGGRMTFFNGEATPGRIELASAKMVRAALAAEVNGSKRMYGYINDHLAWAEDLVAFGHDLGSYASFFLHRTVDGDGNEVRE
jgi:hypothetical protein